jgi:predicted RNase H-like HicB family nuclease
MKTYDLCLESGPQHKKTMVHVMNLAGCIANGPTTEAALKATPDAIRAYLRFLARHGEAVDPDAPFKTRVVEHVTKGMFLGSGSTFFEADLKALRKAEIEPLLARSRWLRAALAGWAGSRTAKQLDAAPRGGGWPARRILLHVMPIGYLPPVLGPAKGLSSLARAAERGDVPLADAIIEIGARNADRVRQATAEQRAAVIERADFPRTLRRAVRRMLEHDFEHLAELSRRPGAPEM